MKLQLCAIDTMVGTTCQDNARFAYASKLLQIDGVENNGGLVEGGYHLLVWPICNLTNQTNMF